MPRSISLIVSITLTEFCRSQSRYGS